MLINLEEQQEIVKKYEKLTENLEKWKISLESEEYFSPNGYTLTEDVIYKIKSILNG